MVHEFQYRAPRTRPELLSLLAEHGASARILAGGTDLLPNMRMGIAKPTYVIDCKRLPNAGRLAFSPTEGLVIGHGVTVAAILQDPEVRERYPLLAEAGRQLASHQVRNRATVAGNVVNASPCSDMALPLLCLYASAVLVSAKSERIVGFREFFTGPKSTVLRSDEFLAEIRVPAASVGLKGRYAKLKRIRGHDLGIVGVLLARAQDGLRAAVSSAAPTPVLVTGIGFSLDAESVEGLVQKAIQPIDDVRCTAEYRRYMVGAFLRRLLPEVSR
ncbi:MAG TPA: FAD binding domain-containing protein [Magnetospirillaceae bacterium]|nr:FAD binding domain-containing protein [Magnetospirillaceae bacterium]